MIENKNEHHSQSHSQFLSVNVNCTQLQVLHTPQPEAALVTCYLTCCTMQVFLLLNASHLIIYTHGTLSANEI